MRLRLRHFAPSAGRQLDADRSASPQRDSFVKGAGRPKLSQLISRIEQLEGRTLLSAPTQFTSRGAGGGGALFSPAFSPSNSNELYVVTDMSELFHSTNLGSSWSFPDFRQIQGGRSSQVQFTSDPNTQFTLDYTESAGVVSPAETVDDGLHWSRLAGWSNQIGNNAYSLYADPNSTSRLIATDYSNVYFSNDGGQTWATKFTTASSAGVYTGGVFWDPNSQNIYIGTNQGLLVSANGGTTFTASSASGIGSGQSIESFTGAKQNGVTRLFAVTWNAADVFPGMDVEGSPLSYQNTYSLTVGANANWAAANTGIGTDHPFYVAMSPSNINTVYLGGTDSTASNPTVEKSTNAGGQWTDILNVVNNGNVATGWQGAGGDRGWGFSQETLGFAVSPSNPNILAFTDFGYVHLSTDGGGSWHQAYVNPADQNPAGQPTPQHKAYHGIGLEDTSALWLNWSDANNMFAGYTDIIGTRSTDAGQSWAFPNYNGLGQNTIYQVSDASNGTLYAADSSIHDVYQSTHLTDSTIDGGTGSVLYSTDKGADWSLLHNFGHPVIYTALDPTNANRLYASVVSSTSGGIYVTNDLQDGAASVWTKLPSPPRTQGHPYNIDVLNDGTLVVTYSARRATVNGTTQFTSSSGVFVSINGGQTWVDRSDPGMDYWTKDLTIDPTDPTQNTWYAAVRSGYGGDGSSNNKGGLYKTTNRGVTWTRVFTSLGVESSTINHSTGEMYVSTTDSGLYYSPSVTNLNLQQLASYPFRQPERIFINPFNSNEVWVTSFGWGISVANTSATASFVGINSTTGGAWAGVFGSQGVNIAGDPGGNTLPAYATFSTNSPAPNVWAAPSSTNNDDRDLQTVENSANTVAGDWYGSTFNVNLNLTDGKIHQVALYVLDWDARGRAENISVLDASTNAVLASANAYQFYELLTGQGGSPSSPPKYLVFNVSGNVTFKFTDIAGLGATGAVLSGLFLDPAGSYTPPAQTFSPTPAPTGGNILLNGSFEGNNGIVHPHPGAATDWGTTTIVPDPGGEQPNVTFRNTEGSTDGAYAAVFNDSETFTNAVLYQTFATTPGTTYTVGFDFGNNSSTATSSQQILAQVFDGTGPFVNSTQTPLGHLAATDTVGTNNGVNPEFLPRQTFTFTAASTTSTIQFTDQSTQISNSDGVLDNVTVIPTAPALVGSPVVNGDNPNGLFNANGQATPGIQRSMVEDVVYTFSSAVTIPNAAAAFTVIATGAHPGTVPASLTATAVTGSGGTQWAVTLTGGAAGTLASIANGEYGITINPSAVFAAANGTTQLSAGRSDQFYRLFGDINGDEVVNAADNGQFKRALTTYNPAFDSNGDGAVNAADNGQFKRSLVVSYLGDGFTTSI